MSEYHTPVVPFELSSGLTDRILEVHERYANYNLHDFIKLSMGEGPAKIPAGEDTTNYVSLGNPTDPYATTHVLALPHQQAWKPSMAIRANIYHEANNPDGLTVVLANNSISNRAYRFSEVEQEAIASGNMRPFYERQTRAVEHLMNSHSMRGRVALAGYSLGGLTALGIATVGSDRLDIAEVHSIESPNEDQIPKELKRKFLKSGSWGDQRAAIKDAHLPVLEEALRFDRLALDYARFGIASFTNAENKALSQGMANNNFNLLVKIALKQYEDISIYAGHIVGSQLFNPDVVTDINDPRFVVKRISEGEGNHRHATGDNPIAHALMLRP